MTKSHSRSSQLKSSNCNWRAPFVRWLIILSSAAVAWLIPFNDALVFRAFTSLALVALGAWKEYEAAKRITLIETSVEAVSAKTEVFQKEAEAGIEAAIVRRRLSKERQGRITGKLSGVRLSPLIVKIGYVPTAEQGRELANDFCELLTKLGVTCQLFQELRPEGGIALTDSGVLIGIPWKSAENVKLLGEVLKSEIPESRIELRDRMGWATADAVPPIISVIIGHKK